FGDVRVTRTELEALVRPSFLRSAELLATTIHRAGLSPDRLGGVYLVGGPSRMPLLASLLANQLRIAPTTRDQPETAVAFGLHHVPMGGEDAQLTVPAFAPVAPPVRQQQPLRQQPWQQQPAQQQPGRQQPAQPQPRRPRPPRWTPPPPPPGRSWRKPTTYGVLALALAAIVTTIVLLTGGEEEPVAAPAPAKPVSCDQPGTRDAQGFTDCLRRIAAVVPQGDDCREAPDAAATVGAAAAVTCVFTGDKTSNAINYYQGVAMAGLEDGVRQRMTKGKPVEGTWAAGGLRGRYVAGVGARSGIVLFGAEDAPLSAMLVSTRSDGTARTTAEMVEFFTAQLKP
ncbi:MAG TPA: Hsp70 family protein, partial [Amycolatopsis sp.]|nr:Hsp70 family protein [Amycolatopsis sp.]